MQNVEELALQQARQYLRERGNYLSMTDAQVKNTLNVTYTGGWETFYNETFQDLVA